ncbi:MAG: precorrin-2 dehydrogenase/sirohydrochlorin ferrochelatase family protein [Chloroflexota bacterium]
MKLDGRRAVVVGGGHVAARKVQALRGRGAQVQVVAPELCEQLREQRDQAVIDVIPRGFREADLEGAFLVIAATDDRAVNGRVFAEAERRGLLCNVVDVPELCSFIVPSVISRGDLTVAVSTGGLSPSTAKLVRERLEDSLGPEYDSYLELMASLRPRVKRRYATSEERREAWARIHTSGALAALREGNDQRAREIVETCL